jgi:hypothetical protein
LYSNAETLGLVDPDSREKGAPVRISDEYRQCVVYIFPSREAAESGARAGGSGFIVARNRGDSPQSFLITARHVLDDMSDPFIRMNKEDGEPDIFRTPASWWKDHPDGDDVAAAQIALSGGDRKFVWIWEDAFVTPAGLLKNNIGIGDHVAMLGRFAGHDGKIRNSPAVRFGNISMLNEDTIKNAYGHQQETFLVECHSIPGYSGSPVLVYIPSTARSEQTLRHSGYGPWLLGVDWLHLQDEIAVLGKDRKKTHLKLHVPINSGMAGVIPAWRITLLLDTFKMQDQSIPEWLGYRGK